MTNTPWLAAAAAAALLAGCAAPPAPAPRESEITVTRIVFGLTEFDFPLSRYYASVNGSLDRYSVRTDESVYSNIDGGIGIFGSTMSSEYSFPVDKKYVESFGYKYAGPN